MTTTGDNTAQIVDLSEEKIYDLDMRRKTYKVTTFEELRRQMREAEAKAREAAAREPREPTDAAAGEERTARRWKSTSTSRIPDRRRRSTASTRARSLPRSPFARRARRSRTAAASS